MKRNMEKKDLRIVYMGTPEFAVESLKRLVEGGYQVVGVITMPDKPMGRHGSLKINQMRCCLLLIFIHDMQRNCIMYCWRD